MRAAVIVLVMAWPGVGWAQQIVEQARRPPPLPAQVGCEIWRGANLEGNDATIEWEIRLCPRGDRVEGLFQTSSLVTGWSSRQSEGRWEGDVLRARDVRFVDNRPLTGWYFCLADRWEIRRTGPERALGEYWSTACEDHSRVELRLVGNAAAPPLPAPPPPPIDVDGTPPGQRGTCAGTSCAAAGSARSSSAGLVAVAIAVLARKRKLQAGRRTGS